MLRYLVQTMYLCCRSGSNFASLGEKYVWGVVLQVCGWVPTSVGAQWGEVVTGASPTITFAADYTIIRSVTKSSPIFYSTFSISVDIDAIVLRNVASHLFPLSGTATSQTLTTITCNVILCGPIGLFIAFGSKMAEVPKQRQYPVVPLELNCPGSMQMQLAVQVRQSSKAVFEAILQISSINQDVHKYHPLQEESRDFLVCK